MNGDEQGRVNILHLVLIYVFLPVVSLLVSIFSLIFGHGLNLAILSSKLPFWGGALRRSFLLQKQRPKSSLRFFYQSQLAALVFSFASLSVFFILLISSDVNFVWRSTLLSAELIHSLLNWLATPWIFWPEAQPSLDLLKLTQDSRLSQDYMNTSEFGQWWRFILAAQLFYAFFLRGLTAAICKLFLLKKEKSESILSVAKNKRFDHNMIEDYDQKVELAQVVYEIESDFALNNWCGLDKDLVAEVEQRIHHCTPQYSKNSELEAGPLVDHSAQMVSERWQDSQLLIVKGWEPPLAELADFMQNGQGYLLPLDWNEQGLQVLNSDHLNEWQRFVEPLSNWQLFQLKLLHPEQACD